MTTTSTQNKKLNRSVSFAPKARLHYGLSLRQYTAQEIQDVWYTQSEYNDMKRQCNKDLKKIFRAGEKFKENSTRATARGLEPYTKEGYLRCSRNRNEALRVVLKEQQRLIMTDAFSSISREEEGNGQITNSSISLIYKSVCLDSEIEARKVGLCDQQWVQTYVTNDTDDDKQPVARSDSWSTTSSSHSKKSAKSRLVRHSSTRCLTGRRNYRFSSSSPTTTDYESIIQCSLDISNHRTLARKRAVRALAA